MTAEHTSLLNGKVPLHQYEEGLRASTDTVLLAASAPSDKGARILDMGCGTGAVGLCVQARLRLEDIALTGIDCQANLIQLAEVNARENNLQNRSWFIEGDVGNKAIFNPESFDIIMMNPPYYEEGKRQQSPDASREKAYSGDLEVWMKSATHWLRQGGTLCVIHRADGLSDILNLAQKRFGAIEIWPVHSKADESAIRVVIRMVRNRKTPLIIYPPVILFDENGEQTAQANAVLRDGEGL
jgi:tRNA1(Val) A37 N6-methylase TrmN6